MGIYSTFFLCEPKQLLSGFPEWKPPRAQPIKRTVRNPFTGVETTVETRAPEWPDIEPDEVDVPDYEVVAISGEYATFLEERLRSFVRASPHWCAKNLTCVQLSPLLEAASLEGQDLETPLYPPPSLGASIDKFPTAFVDILKSASDSQLEAIAIRWAAMMSTPEHTLSVTGDRLEDDWTTADAMRLLRPLVNLAKQQTGSQCMYSLLEG